MRETIPARNRRGHWRLLPAARVNGRLVAVAGGFDW